MADSRPMDRASNPFAPGAGIQPPALVGREALLEDTRIDLVRLLAGKTVRSWMLLGLRGVGKTVLLYRMVQAAKEQGVTTIKMEIEEGGKFAATLAPELRRVLHQLDAMAGTAARIRSAFATLRNFVSAFKLSVGEFELGLDPSPGTADTGNLQQDLPQLLCAVAEAARDKCTAVGLYLDEVQYLTTSELASLVVSLHEISQRNLPVYFVGAGLPQVAALAGNAKSYAERLLIYPEVGPLHETAARLALTKPVEAGGAHIDDSAVDEIVRVTEGYPYFIQEWGYHAWNHAKGNAITHGDVISLHDHVRSHLDANFFRVRFDRLTALQQKYLRAMAELGEGPYRTGEVADILGLSAPDAAPIRKQLIDKGMVWSQRYGETDFTVPMFGPFILRQMPLLEKHVPRRRGEKNRPK
jgi:hypothetical protein